MKTELEKLKRMKTKTEKARMTLSVDVWNSIIVAAEVVFLTGKRDEEHAATVKEKQPRHRWKGSDHFLTNWFFLTIEAKQVGSATV